MNDNRELQKFRNSSDAREIAELLQQSGIKFHISKTSRAFDVSQIGGGGDTENDEVLITVAESDFDAARSVLEDSFASTSIPEGHFLQSASDDDLVEVVGNSEEWSPFDVAHAKKMIRDRGINLDLTQEKKAERLELLKKGKAASPWLIWGGWAGALTGGLIGVGIAWSLVSMREPERDGAFYTYDEHSREHGRRMFKVSLVVLAIVVLIRIESN